MEVVTLVYCPKCGTPSAPSDRYCANCGTPTIVTPGYIPYAPVIGPPTHDNAAVIIVVVVVLVILVSIVGSALLYVMVSGLIRPPPMGPIAIGAVIAKSSDGSNWTITFTSVPSTLTIADTYLGISDAGGATAMPLTWIGSFTGGSDVTTMNGKGFLFVRYEGHSGNAVSVGDLILIGTSTTLGYSTTGYRVQIESSGVVLFSGTLQ